MLSLKVTAFGASPGFALDEKAMAYLNLREGDTVYLTQAPDGSYRLTSRDPAFEHQMSLAEEIMREDREVLRALAK